MENSCNIVANRIEQQFQQFQFLTAFSPHFRLLTVAIVNLIYFRFLLLRKSSVNFFDAWLKFR